MKPPEPDGGVAAAAARGVTDRLRTLLLALDRQDRLETAGEFIGWLRRERATGGLEEAARELLLRALRVAGDPVNYRLLASLDRLDGVPLRELMERAGLGRVATSERVHDLVQVGLASREMVDDRVRGTALAAAFTELVEEVAASAGRALSGELAAGGEAAERAGG